jgi:DNA repair exonuclease SbcCD ATPase subunit
MANVRSLFSQREKVARSARLCFHAKPAASSPNALLATSVPPNSEKAALSQRNSALSSVSNKDQETLIVALRMQLAELVDAKQRDDERVAALQQRLEQDRREFLRQNEKAEAKVTTAERRAKEASEKSSQLETAVPE